MMNLEDVYITLINKLKEKSFIEQPALEARMILAYYYNLKPQDVILLNNKKNVSLTDWCGIKQLIKKRLNGKSIASIVKKKIFMIVNFMLLIMFSFPALKLN